jgi:hypothetical protein
MSRPSGRMVLLIALIAVALLPGAWIVYCKLRPPIDLDERIIAVQWGDGKYGLAFYGAFVYMAREPAFISVRARVFIGHGNDYWHDCGEIGRVQTEEEAIEKWGRIVWREDGVHIGDENTGFVLPRRIVEQHR